MSSCFSNSRKMHTNITLLFYIIFIGTLSIALFLYGFFPLVNWDNTIATLNDVPKFVDNVRVKTESLYEPMVEKLVIMVIDALRWDFITGSIGKVSMPVTSSLIANSSACLLQAKVQPPTVTMPRIKAITTGTVPSFIDVALNFGSKPVPGDNVLLQAKRQHYKSVFYGDETWLALFPDLFERYEGTTSFLVTDFTEVDINVTRNVYNELHNSNNWSIMILHYLGLDHIGHVHGPFSPLVKPKLKEMDNIIAEIQSKIREWNQNNDPSLFIICGDHGMKDSGGHGGSTLSETTVPFIAIGGACSQRNDQTKEIDQIDIASTLSVILGVPIPFSNLGTVFVDTLYELPVSKKLFVLYYNSKQVFGHFKKLTGYQSQTAYRKYLDAIKLHVAWLNMKVQPNDMTDDIIQSYVVALKGMKEMLISSMIKYDSHVITTAIFFLCHIICIMLGTQHDFPSMFQRAMVLILLNIITWILTNYFWASEGTSFLFSYNIVTIMLTSFAIPILSINCYILASIKFSDFLTIKKTEITAARWLLSFGSLVHAISLGGSSFVEEEHQTWYFYWVTILTVLLYNSATKLVLHIQSCRSYKQCSHTQVCIKLLLLLIGHRVLRKLNSTGDKYAHLPDIAGYLMEQESSIGMTILLITALACLVWISFIHEDSKYKKLSLIFNITISICIYLRHMQNAAVAKIPLYPASRGIYEVQVFWVLLVIYTINCTYRLALTIQSKRTKCLNDILYFIVHMWIMIAAMLHQPHNVILLPCQIIFSNVIRTVMKDNVPLGVSTIVYAWCGNVFYFYQGNSNSLATIDVAAGYVGLQSYMPLINGTFLLINTYSAPVLAYLLLVYHTVLQYPYEAHEVVAQTSKIYITWRLLPATIYTIIISIQRHHLFVWSVFSPKLLYEAVHSTVTCFVAFIILIPVYCDTKFNK